MAMDIGKYRQFFDIDEKYFPCIDDSAIQAGASWENTYPHKDFITLLKNTERMLGGSTKRSLWIHGAYGTGKSQCAYALKKILEVPEDELKAYWNEYDNLRENQDLLQKLIGHRNRGIVTTYRYASGGISQPRDLFFAIQESVKKALLENPKITYYGENTLKESVISWISETSHKAFFNDLLKKPEWNATFSQSTADEVIEDLQKNDNIKDLIDNIFLLADKEGITAMSLDADMLKAWLKDIITKNNTKIVFIWDEFSGFFKQNRNSLDEFQKIVALCQEVPFYLVVVTHQTESIINNEDQSWSVVKQRFDFVLITLPDNIAFDLIGHAFNVKKAAKDDWNELANDLNSQLNDSRKAVMAAAKVSSPKVIKDIMPIHPMAALVLKNIASAFQSNQRSMFDFIKTSNTDDTQAFQWFIENTGPADDHPLLTIDMLWDFFYEKGKDGLTSDIRMILDTFPQQQNLREDEERVLKAILIMQAIDKRLGGSIDLLKPTDQNISYAFEGIQSGLDTDCKNIAKGLCNRGILVLNPIGNNKYAYGAAVLAGDQAKIDEYKKSVKKISTTAKLIAEGGLASALALTPPLKLRFADDIATGAMVTVCTSDFNRVIDAMKNKDNSWHFNAVLALAKNNEEAIALRKQIKAAALKEEYKNIVFIDALDTPLGEDDFNAYVEYSAMAQYYQSNNNQSSKENANKAKQILSINWKNRIYKGSFVMYYNGCEDGEKVVGALGVSNILQAIVLRKYEYLFDFEKGITETQMKSTTTKVVARMGIERSAKGLCSNLDKNILPEVWNLDKYWENETTKDLGISIIKRNVDEYINSAFDKDGQISIGEIYDSLVAKYGFAPCNLSCFITGFLLKEYAGTPYRYSDSSGSHEEMTFEKMSEMIGNYVNGNSKPTYIVKMTADEKAFYDVTELAWGIPSNECSSASQASIRIKNKMQSLGLPVWSLADIDTLGVYDIVNDYISLVQKEGNEAHQIAISIGSKYRKNNSLGQNLRNLITAENCKKGMLVFLQRFDGGKLWKLAGDIGANDRLISDIRNLFSVQFSSFWKVETGKEQINFLITDYTFVKITNEILGTNISSKKDAYTKWQERIAFIKCSCEALKDKYPNFAITYDFLLKISKNIDILPEQLKVSTNDLIENADDIKYLLDNELDSFKSIYSAYLCDLSDEDISQLNISGLTNMFRKSKSESNIAVKNLISEFKKNQAKNKMFSIWKKNTNTKNPAEWSYENRTPILLMVDKKEYDEAKKTFETLNRNTATENEINKAILFLENTRIFDTLNDKAKIDAAFVDLLGSYKNILTNIDDVRESLEKTSVPTYEWGEHPTIKSKICQLAKAEYDAGGSDRVIIKIENMQNDELKSYLIRLVKENMNLGVEIINGGE